MTEHEPDSPNWVRSHEHIEIEEDASPILIVWLLLCAVMVLIIATGLWWLLG